MAISGDNKNKTLSRRAFTGLSVALATTIVHGDEPLDLDDYSGTLSRDARGVQRWLEEEFELLGSRLRAPGNLTPSTAAKYTNRLRTRAREVFGLQKLNSQRDTTIKSEITGVIERDTYRIEKVLYFSRDNYPVTALLYLPSEANHGNKKLPAVLGLCGHSFEGKAYPGYQAFAQSLAHHGFMCLLIDPIGQGERLLRPVKKEQGFVSDWGGATTQHNQFGLRAGLFSEFCGAWRAWDAVRGVDYLLSRPEVAPKQIGVTGNSGGGTMTTWMTALEDRFAFSAPSCFVTTLESNLRNELPADAEQCPPRTLTGDLLMDHWHYLAANAPNPLIVISQRNDFFDFRGTEQAIQNLKKVYQAFGAGQNLAWHLGDGEHGFHRDGRIAMVRHFLKAVGRPWDVDEPKLQTESVRELRCSTSGQVESESTRTTCQFLVEMPKAKKQRRQIDFPTRLMQSLGLEDIKQISERIQKHMARSVSVLRAVTGKAPYRQRSRFALLSVNGLRPIVYRASEKRLLAVPSQEQTPAILHIASRSSQAELNSPPNSLQQAIDSAGDEFALYSIDVRGVGELQPRVATPGSIDDIYGADYMHAAYAEMLGKPMLGRRVLDALAALEWLSRLHPNIIISGHDRSALVAQVLVALDALVLKRDRISASVYSDEPDLESLAKCDTELPPYSLLPFGLLKSIELSELRSF